MSSLSRPKIRISSYWTEASQFQVHPPKILKAVQWTMLENQRESRSSKQGLVVRVLEFIVSQVLVGHLYYAL